MSILYYGSDGKIHELGDKNTLMHYNHNHDSLGRFAKSTATKAWNSYYYGNSNGPLSGSDDYAKKEFEKKGVRFEKDSTGELMTKIKQPSTPNRSRKVHVFIDAKNESDSGVKEIVDELTNKTKLKKMDDLCRKQAVDELYEHYKKNPDLHDPDGSINRNLSKDEFSKHVHLDQISYDLNGIDSQPNKVSLFYIDHLTDYSFSDNCWLVEYDRKTGKILYHQYYR